jgi:hypothetical protein
MIARNKAVPPVIQLLYPEALTAHSDFLKIEIIFNRYKHADPPKNVV